MAVLLHPPRLAPDLFYGGSIGGVFGSENQTSSGYYPGGATVSAFSYDMYIFQLAGIVRFWYYTAAQGWNNVILPYTASYYEINPIQVESCYVHVRAHISGHITISNLKLYAPNGTVVTPPNIHSNASEYAEPDREVFGAAPPLMLAQYVDSTPADLQPGWGPQFNALTLPEHNPALALQPPPRGLVLDDTWAGITGPSYLSRFPPEGHTALDAPVVYPATKDGEPPEKRGHAPSNKGWTFQTECDSCALHFSLTMEATGEHTRIQAQYSGAEDMRVSFIVGAAPSGYTIMSAPRIRIVFGASGYGFKTMAWVKFKFSMTADGYRKVFAANRYGSVHPWPGHWSGGQNPQWIPWVPPRGWFPHGSMFMFVVGSGRLTLQNGHAPTMQIKFVKRPYWAPDLPPGETKPNPTPDIDPVTGEPVIDPETGMPKDPTNGYGGFGVRVRVGVMHTTWFVKSHDKIKFSMTVGEPHHTPAGFVEFRLRINFRYPMPIGEVTDLGEAHAAMTMLMFGNWYPIGGSHSQFTFNVVGNSLHTAKGKCTFECHVRFINYTGKHFTIGYLKPMNIWLSSLAGKLQPSNFGDVPGMFMSFGCKTKGGWVIPVRPLNAIEIHHRVQPRIPMRLFATSVRPEMESTP